MENYATSAGAELEKPRSAEDEDVQFALFFSALADLRQRICALRELADEWDREYPRIAAWYKHHSDQLEYLAASIELLIGTRSKLPDVDEGGGETADSDLTHRGRA